LENKPQDKISISTLFGCALTMALGWNVFGNDGTPLNAAIPGMLASVFICLHSRRIDWYPRVLHFALYGAVGWSFGSFMPLDRVMGYTYTGSQYTETVLYGTACLSLIGFLWGMLGGMFTSMPACLREDHLRKFTPFLFLLLFSWMVNIFIVPDDWLPVLLTYPLTVLIVSALYALFLRVYVFGFVAVLYAILGWFAGWILLAKMGGLHLSPPTSDVWAGIAGMIVMLCVFLIRNGYSSIVLAGLTAGFWGAAALPIANTIRLTVYSQNALYPYPEIMYLVQGGLQGLGLAFAVYYCAVHSSRLQNDRKEMDWKFCWLAVVSLSFIALFKLFQHVETSWLESGAFSFYTAEQPFFLWKTIICLSFYLPLFFLVFRFRNNNVSFLPESWFGKGQLIFCLLLWVFNGLYLLKESVEDSYLSINSIMLIAGCVIIYTVLRNSIPPQPLTGSKNRYGGFKKQIISTAVSWIIITILFIVLLTGIHIRLLKYPTKGHHFRFSSRDSSLILNSCQPKKQKKVITRRSDAASRDPFS